MNDHDLATPPLELVKKWIEDWAGAQMKGIPSEEYMEIATQAAQWGYERRGAVNEAELQKARDEELEACCEWLEAIVPSLTKRLRAARRPEPKNQAEEALETLHSMRIAPVVINGINVNANVMNRYELIRAALERLRELEGNQ